jgi:hypothetical protein
MTDIISDDLRYAQGECLIWDFPTKDKSISCRVLWWPLCAERLHNQTFIINLIFYSQRWFLYLDEEKSLLNEIKWKRIE